MESVVRLHIAYNRLIELKIKETSHIRKDCISF